MDDEKDIHRMMREGYFQKPDDPTERIFNRIADDVKDLSPEDNRLLRWRLAMLVSSDDHIARHVDYDFTIFCSVEYDLYSMRNAIGSAMDARKNNKPVTEEEHRIEDGGMKALHIEPKIGDRPIRLVTRGDAEFEFAALRAEALFRERIEGILREVIDTALKLSQ